MTKRRIRRDDAPTTGQNIDSLSDDPNDPRYLSLVGRPANRRPFKVVRQENEEEEMEQPAARVHRKRTRRNDRSKILQVNFGESTVEQAEADLATYGLTDYTILEEEGQTIARRSDLQSIAMDSVESVKLSETATLLVERSAEVQATPGKNQLALVRMEFDPEKFGEEEAEAFLAENGVDFEPEALDNSTGKLVLQRMDVDEQEETREMELADGVKAVIVRHDVMNIPDGFVVVISETAYGGWGWGQLDFNARLADVEVGEKLREGMNQLTDLLHDILYWSQLPVDIRKELLTRALSQAGGYFTGLLDQLPRQLLMAVNVQRSDKTQENSEMSEKSKPTNAKPEMDQTPLTRADIPALVEAFGAAMKSDAPEAVPAADAAPAPAATSEEPESKPLTRADLAAALAEHAEKIKSTVVVRSDAGDPNAEEAEEGRQTVVKRADGTIDEFASLNLF